MDLINSKSILAKLMATENLRIEQRKVATASFDIRNRVLVVPILDKNISSDLYDLFMGHEVGHALYTPLEGLLDALQKQKLNKSVINLLEDSRIERKIKMKYPGLRHSFFNGYKDLMHRDFFGVMNKDLDKLNFIDRINLYCKVGADLNISFTDDEKVILREVENTQTFEDVLEVYKKVMQRLEEEQEEDDKKFEYVQTDLDGDFEDYDFEFVDEDSEDRSDSDILKIRSEESEDDAEEGEGDSSDSEKNEDKESNKESKDGNSDKSEGDESGEKVSKGNEGGKVGKNKEEIRSITDEEYRKNESKLFSEESKNYYYATIPKLPMKKIIIDHKVIWSEYQHNLNYISNLYGSSMVNEIEKNKVEEFKKFREDSKSIVSYLVKEFELRKNANQMKRVSIAKTGDLNMNRIFSYNFSEDIFKKAAIVPDGKSHGLVMFLDWSGSMSDYLVETIRQLLNLVMFCKSVKIPYEVYAFSTIAGERLSLYGHPRKLDIRYEHFYRDGNINLLPFHLMNLLSSKMSASEFASAAGYLLAWNENRLARPDFMELHGTPLNEAIVAAMDIVPKFQKDYRLQVVNTVFLTDGAGQANKNIFGVKYQELPSRRSLVICDPVSKAEALVSDFENSDQLTAAYVKLLKARTNCNIVGFYILRTREFGAVSRYFNTDKEKISDEKYKQLRADFRKDKYIIVTSAGFDEYYILKSDAIDTVEEFTVKDDASIRSIATAFSKFSMSRKTSRVVLNRFINMIS